MLAGATYGAVPDRVPVLLELFTSEGCSSCPPADRLLEKLDRDQPVAGAELIVLSEHVDYWNRLGWTDPYSSADFSRRQQDYAAHFRTNEIYTPQLVVDGVHQAVGGNWPMVERAIRESLQEKKTAITLSKARTRNGALVHVEAPPLTGDGGKALVYLAIAANHAESHVTRGENRGRVLKHAAVVRQLTAIGDAESPSAAARTELTLDPAWKRERLTVVAFVQERRSRTILASAAARLASLPRP